MVSTSGDEFSRIIDWRSQARVVFFPWIPHRIKSLNNFNHKRDIKCRLFYSILLSLNVIDSYSITLSWIVSMVDWHCYMLRVSTCDSCLLVQLYLHESRAFLMRIFTVFLLLTAPASRNANPACITEINKGNIIQQSFYIQICWYSKKLNTTGFFY